MPEPETAFTNPVPEGHDHREINPETGMQLSYKILSDAERAQGFVRPYRDTYTHHTCGGSTKMGRSLSETYARDPYFYSGTYCATCMAHFPLDQFTWDLDGTMVGS